MWCNRAKEVDGSLDLDYKYEISQPHLLDM